MSTIENEPAADLEEEEEVLLDPESLCTQESFSNILNKLCNIAYGPMEDVVLGSVLALAAYVNGPFSVEVDSQGSLRIAVGSEVRIVNVGQWTEAH